MIPLAPTDEEREDLKKQLIKKRELARLAKEAKKSSKKSARREKAATTAAAKSASSHSAGAASTSAAGGPHASLHGKPSAVGDETNEKIGRSGAGEEQETADDRNERRKNKKRRRAEREAAAAAATGHTSAGPDSARVAGAAAQAVEKHKQNDAVYASLFGKKDVSNEHLFIATAGHRYNLG